MMLLIDSQILLDDNNTLPSAFRHITERLSLGVAKTSVTSNREVHTILDWIASEQHLSLIDSKLSSVANELHVATGYSCILAWSTDSVHHFMHQALPLISADTLCNAYAVNPSEQHGICDAVAFFSNTIRDCDASSYGLVILLGQPSLPTTVT